jgi:hypothetical protein
MDDPNIPKVEDNIVDDIDVDIPSCYNSMSTPNPETISLDHPTHKYVSYLYPFH